MQRSHATRFAAITCLAVAGLGGACSPATRSPEAPSVPPSADAPAQAPASTPVAPANETAVGPTLPAVFADLGTPPPSVDRVSSGVLVLENGCLYVRRAGVLYTPVFLSPEVRWESPSQSLVVGDERRAIGDTMTARGSELPAPDYAEMRTLAPYDPSCERRTGLTFVF